MMRKKILLALPLLILVLGALIYLAAFSRARSLVDGEIERQLASGLFQDLRYESLSLKLNGDVQLKNLHAVDFIGNEYILQDLVLSDLDYRHAIPRRFILNVSGLAFPSGLPRLGAYSASEGWLGGLLEALVRDNAMPLFLNYRYRYQPEDEFTLDGAFAVGVENAFSLSSSSVMKNIPLESFGDAPSASPAAEAEMLHLLLNASIPMARLELADLGLAEALLKAYSQESGMTVDEYRRELLVLLSITQSQFLAMLGMQDWADEISAGAASLLEGGKTLRISVTPAYGGDIQRLQPEIMAAYFNGDFDEIIDLLALEISVQ